jgi:TPR repeat protein
MYSNGEGVTKSPEKAFAHYQAAGQHGSLPAIFHLAEMYLLGQGTGIVTSIGIQF